MGLTSNKLYYREINAKTLLQTASYFNIEFHNYNGLVYDQQIKKDIYNVRLDYADYAYGLTNHTEENDLDYNYNPPKVIHNGFGYDDDMPAYYYEHYDSLKVGYEYNMLLSFNHY